MPPATPSTNDEARRTATVFGKLNRLIETDLHVRRRKIIYKKSNPYGTFAEVS